MSLKLKNSVRSLGVLLVSLMVASTVLVGAAAAYDADSGEFETEMAIDDGTQEVFVDVHGVEADAVEVDIEVVGLHSSDDELDETELHSETVEVSGDEVVSSTYELTDDDRDDYEAVEVTAVVDEADSEHIDDVEAGLLEEVMGGGGVLDGDIAGFPAVVVLGVVAITGLVLLRGDD